MTRSLIMKQLAVVVSLIIGLSVGTSIEAASAEAKTVKLARKKRKPSEAFKKAERLAEQRVALAKVLIARARDAKSNKDDKIEACIGLCAIQYLPALSLIVENLGLQSSQIDLGTEMPSLSKTYPLTSYVTVFGLAVIPELVRAYGRSKDATEQSRYRYVLLLLSRYASSTEIYAKGLKATTTSKAVKKRMDEILELVNRIKVRRQREKARVPTKTRTVPLPEKAGKK
jgi:hypothetical protein